MASRSTSRSRSASTSRNTSPRPSTSIASRRASRARAPTPTASPSPLNEINVDEFLEELNVPMAENVHAFVVPNSPEPEAENDDVQDALSPSSAPPTVAKEPAQVRDGQQSKMKLAKLLKSSIEELESFSRMDEAHVANLVELPTTTELFKMIIIKKKCEQKRSEEMEQLKQMVKAREDKISEQSTKINADKIRANHAAQNKHLEPAAVQLRVRSQITRPPLSPIDHLQHPAPQP